METNNDRHATSPKGDRRVEHVDAGFHVAGMRTTILEVGGMLSVLDFLGVEKRLKCVPGVHAASVNIATNTAVVQYDEIITNVGELRANIIGCGFHCGGEVLPKHICKTRTDGPQETGLDASKTTRR
jgi:P-type Cu2+ transporter